MKPACLRQRTTTKSSLRSSCRAARLRAVAFASFGTAVLLASLPVRADDYWALLPSATGDWSKSANWSGGIPASGTNVYVVNGGTAVISVLGEACGNLTLGNTAGSGTICMMGGGLSVPTGDDEYVGSTGAGTFTQTGGTNAISAAIDAQHLYHSLYVGYGTGSGTYNLSGSGLITTGGLVVSNNAPGAFTQSGGTVSVTYGTYVGNYATGTYSLSGSGLLSADTESIGWSGSGTFNQSGGQNVVRHLNLGDNDFSRGTYNLNGGTLHSTGGLFVGAIGSGSFSQLGGTNVASGGLTLGAFQGGSGTYNLNGGALVPSALGGGPGYFVFNFGGGTLQASGALSTTLPMTLSGNGSGATYDTAGYTMTLSGSLSGPGGLTKVDSGTLTLAASDSYTGTTIIRAGTLSLANSAALAGGGNITFGGGSLQYTSSNSRDYSGKIVGSTGPISIDTNGVNVTCVSNLVSSNVGGLTKVGSGTLTLAVANAYGGNTWIGGGTLALGSSLALQNSTLDTSGSGVLSFGSLSAATFGGLIDPGTLALANSASAAVAVSVGNNNGSSTFSGMLKGAGSLNKIGSGTLAFSGSNTYTGPTTISQGRLTVDGWLPNSPVSVNGGTLGGTGYLSSVSVSASGTLAPGDALGVLSLSGNLVLSASATMDFELDGVSTDDEISMPSGSLTFSGQQFANFGFTWTAGFGPGSYTLVSAKSITGLGSNLSGSIDGLPASLSVQNNDLMLTVVPEPGTLALLGIVPLLLGFVKYARRHRDFRPPLVVIAVFAAVLAGNQSASAQVTFVRSFGDSGSGNGQFRGVGCSGLSIDSSGNVWVTDSDNHRVQCFDNAGNYLRQFATNNGAGTSYYPEGVCVDPHGNIWVSETNYGVVQEYTPNGQLLMSFGTGGSGNGQLYDPQNVAVDTLGDIWVADSQNNRLEKFDSHGNYLSQFSTGPYSVPTDVAIDRSGNLWVVASGSQVSIKEFDTSGDLLLSFGSRGTGPGQVETAYGLAMDSTGNLWVSDTDGYCVDEFTPSGHCVTRFGSKGSGNGQFSLPGALAFDPSGNLWVGDYGNKRVQEFAVPEPSTLALLGVGALGLIAYVWRRRRAKETVVGLLLATALLASVVAARADVFHMPSGETSIKMVPVGNPGNAPDTAVMTDHTTGYGSVSYNYNIDAYDVTLAQYTTFLNAVAKTDPYGCYNSFMANGDGFFPFGIARTGSPGSYSYSVTGSNPHAANMPVFDINWLDAARFCNWLQNGQLTTGVENNTTTEAGAYTLNGDTTSGLETKNAGATYSIPSENEWYKAAYYNPSSGTYSTYATRSNIAPSNSLVLVPNDANYFNGSYTDSTNCLTPVGYFSTSPSYYGTFDQSGDVWNWNDAIISGSIRGVRGGSWNGYSYTLASSDRISGYPTNEYNYVGFRVASVPEPGSIALLLAGGFSLVAYVWRRRRAKA